jgi:threonine synthase
MGPIENYVTHLQSAFDGKTLPFGPVYTTHRDRPLFVTYDLKAIRRAVQPSDLARRAPDMWRYSEFLPPADGLVSLGETMTPLLRCPRLGALLGLLHLYVKDESHLPTGSFKARGMAMAITMAKSLGIDHVALPSAGNAGGAAAAYAARAGLKCTVFMPSDAPEVNRLEAGLFGAEVVLVDGLITDCGARVREGVERRRWFDLSTLREPYRLEGKKTMGLELAEQLGWKLPDVILYPTGGGTGLIGMWKAFQELRGVGWLHGRYPRMYACQSTGCAPLVHAYNTRSRFARTIAEPRTVAAGLRVPSAIGDFMILDAVRASGGRVAAAPENRLVPWMRVAAKTEGLSLCPEAAACLGVLEAAVKAGEILPDQTVVVFNTGAAQKYVEALRPAVPAPHAPWTPPPRQTPQAPQTV